MNICIESNTLNHDARSGLKTYTEGLVYGMYENDPQNDYTLTYYSLHRDVGRMPGPSGRNFSKVVLKMPDGEFWKRQFIVDNLVLPGFFKANKVRVFHRPAGCTLPAVKNVFKILTVHDLRTLTIGDVFYKQNIAEYRKALQSLDLCVVVSQTTKADLIRYFGVDHRKIKVIYLGVHKRFRRLEPGTVEAVKAKYGIDQPYLLSMGSVPRKNIKGIIEGFASTMASKKFILVLGCSMDLEKYQRMTREFGIEKRVKFLNKVDDEEAVALYNGCHCFVFPSFYEGFGLPIVEAMRCGAPVITSNVSACPEVAGDAAILVDPHNFRQIGGAIETICSDDACRKQLVEKGQERAKLFGWEAFAQEMKEIYAKV